MEAKRNAAWLCAAGVCALFACGESSPRNPDRPGSGAGLAGANGAAGQTQTQSGSGGASGSAAGGSGAAAGAISLGGMSGGGQGGAVGSAAGTTGSAGTAVAVAGSGPTSAGSGSEAPASGQCGARSGMRGKTDRTVDVGGSKRTVIAYLPQDADPSVPLPFVYVFHGANQSGRILYDMTEYAKLADREKIAVVFPDGQGVSSATGASSLSPWNVSDGGLLCGLGTLVSNPNAVDFAFMDAIQADVSKDQCLDDQHVYATGFSMGGYFSHHVACMRPGIRAAAPHSGGTLSDLGTCTNSHMPIIIFHGNADPLIDDACDDPLVGAEPGFTASPTLWAMKNGCKTTYQTVPTDGPSGKGQCLIYDGCPADGQVEACIFSDLGHAWAGAPVCESCIGEGAGWASATQLEWEFFEKYAW
jgi:polyhydroxybutyrate depolymerase